MVTWGGVLTVANALTSAVCEGVNLYASAIRCAVMTRFLLTARGALDMLGSCSSSIGKSASVRVRLRAAEAADGRKFDVKMGD